MNSLGKKKTPNKNRFPLLKALARLIPRRKKNSEVDSSAWMTDPTFWISKIVTTDNVQVVQIGSNDGKTGDPLYPLFQRHPTWKGLFVEPVPYLYERLKKNYPETDRFTFENSVVNHGEIVAFYWVEEGAKEKPTSTPGCGNQLGSLDKGHILKHSTKLEPFIQETELSSVTLEALLDRHQIEDITIFHIDTEGADSDILLQLDLTRFRPQVILFERVHLSSEQEQAAIEHIKASYVMFNFGADILAVEKEVHETMLSTLCQLEENRIGS